MNASVDKPDFPSFARLWDELAPARAWVHSRTRLSVRTVMVLVLVIGSGLGWLERGARLQRQAVAAVQAAGGRYWFDRDWRVNPSVIDPYKPPANPWLASHVDVNYAANVIGITLVPRKHRDPARANDETLARIGKLDRLEFLALNSTAVTDAGLAHLEDKTWLQVLELCDTEITDAGLERLRGLTGLRRLYLMNTLVTTQGVKRFQDARPGVQIIR